MISILHASRGRAQKAFETSQRWISRAGTEVEYILSIDNDDPQGKEYDSLFRGYISNQNTSAIEAFNQAAKASSGDILVAISDDFDCPENWGKSLITYALRTEDFILKTQDGIQKWMITLPLMDRAYYNRFGYIYYPGYQHMFCDTEMSCVADLTGRKIVSDLIFPHRHYSVTKEQRDATSIKADNTWEQGKKLFIERYKKDFDLKEVNGKIQDQGMINWIVQHG